MNENEQTETTEVTESAEVAEVMFGDLTQDQKLNVIYQLLLEQRGQILSALDLINSVGQEVGPMMESLKSSPAFKMLGFGKKL